MAAGRGSSKKGAGKARGGSGAGAVLERMLEGLLGLMGSLLGLIQLQGSVVLPLMRTAMQAVAVEVRERGRAPGLFLSLRLAEPQPP